MNTPIIKKIEDTSEGLKSFHSEMSDKCEKDIMLSYPTVYIHNWEKTGYYEVYVGESNDVIQRTKQHLDLSKNINTWQSQLKAHHASLYIIGHEHFNKSLTLALENKLMMYLTSSANVKRIHNLRGNPQRQYYPDTEFDDIFHMVWDGLNRDNQELFPNEREILDSSLFKASPLHKLTEDQERVRNLIIERVYALLDTKDMHQIIFIDGEAGTGKTVLNSSTFYELYARREEDKDPITCYMLVNHEQQVRVYHQIADKLGLIEKYGDIVCKPTHFINTHSVDEPVDVAFVDEAHLLLTQKSLGYYGDNQLKEIVERARVTVVMFDENQILTAEQYWESKIINEFRNQAKKNDNYFILTEQLRMKASKEVVDWIDSFTKECIIEPLPSFLGDYEIRFFDTPEELDSAIKDKSVSNGHSLSRVIATYDWDYSNTKAREDRLSKYWEVVIGHWSKPWNYELEKDMTPKQKKEIKTQAWAEQKHTINEVGSTFTIQGFDLNYAGVILGPSVKYRNGRVEFDPSEKNYEKMTRNRTLSDGTKKAFGKELTQHEVRVLMTRAVEGLYIYACDDELRKALMKARG